MVATILFSAFGFSRAPPTTVVEIRLWPCVPGRAAAPPVPVWPRTRCQMFVSARDVPRSGLATKLESGTLIPRRSCRRSSAVAGAAKRSSQVTSLAIRRRYCAPISAPTRAALPACAERVGEAAEAADPELERVDQVSVLRTQRPGRVEALCGRDELLVLLGVPVQGPDEGGLAHFGSRQRRRELRSDPLRAVADLPDVLHVAGIPILFRLAPAARDPEDEQDDDEDREADEPDQPEQRGQTRWRPLRTARAARAPSRAFGLDGPRVAAPRRSRTRSRYRARSWRQAGVPADPPNDCIGGEGFHPAASTPIAHGHGDRVLPCQ